MRGISEYRQGNSEVIGGSIRVSKKEARKKEELGKVKRRMELEIRKAN
jgi:hypothetical protein